MTIKVEDSQGRTHLREGQFIEPIQLQVVLEDGGKTRLIQIIRCKEKRQI
jgi:hypothetical protein